MSNLLGALSTLFGRTELSPEDKLLAEKLEKKFDSGDMFINENMSLEVRPEAMEAMVKRYRDAHPNPPI